MESNSRIIGRAAEIYYCDNIIPRKSLSKNTKRTGWQGCNLHFTNIHFIIPVFKY